MEMHRHNLVLAYITYRDTDVKPTGKRAFTGFKRPLNKEVLMLQINRKV